MSHGQKEIQSRTDPSSSSPPSDPPRNPEPPTLNALSTSIPNRERRFGVIRVVCQQKIIIP